MQAPQVHSLAPAWGRYRDDPIAYFAMIAHTSNDDVLLFGLGPARVGVCNSPRAVEELLVTKANDFGKASGTSNAAIPWAGRFFGSGLLAAEGATWLRARRIAQPAFHAERLRGYEVIIDEVNAGLVEAWQHGGERDVYADALDASLAVLSRTLIGGLATREQTLLLTALAQVFDLQRPEKRHLPLPTWVPSPRNRSTARLADDLDSLVYDLIQRRRQAPEAGSDLVSLLLAASDESGQPLSDQVVRDEVMTMLLAAHDPTASALARTLQLLADHPDVQQRLRHELVEARRAGRDPATSSRLLHAVVDESLRLFPPSRGISRRARQATMLVGTPVDSGTIVVAHQRMLHRDPKLFDEPNRFRPDRWLDAHRSPLPRAAFFPFGMGPRMCIGHAFALIEIRRSLASLLSKCSVGPATAGPSAWHQASGRPVSGVLLSINRELAS